MPCVSRPPQLLNSLRLLFRRHQPLCFVARCCGIRYFFQKFKVCITIQSKYPTFVFARLMTLMDRGKVPQFIDTHEGMEAVNPYSFFSSVMWLLPGSSFHVPSSPPIQPRLPCSCQCPSPPRQLTGSAFSSLSALLYGRPKDEPGRG